MNERPLAILNRTETILLVVTVALSSLISLLDLFGVLDGVPWLRDNIPTLTLLTVGLLAGYILIERRTKLETIVNTLQDSVDTNQLAAQRIIESLNGVEVRSFENVSQCMQYVNRALRAARVQVDDLSWTAALGSSDDLESAVTESLRYQQQVRLTAAKLPYREVLIFNKEERKDRLVTQIEENAPGYSCGYYDQTPDVPLLQFMIIDREEVIVLTGDYSYLAFRHPRLVNLFVEYYDDIWKKSRTLKRGNSVQWTEVEKVLGKEKVQNLRAQM